MGSRDRALFRAAWDTAREHQGDELTFYLPGMVRYGGQRGRYPAISITGENCQLMCDHCKGQLLQPMIKITEPDELISSRVRYFRAVRLLKQLPSHTIKSLQAIQRDHINHPDSICNHAMDYPDPLDRQKTINALVIDLNAGVMHLAWGNPCQNPFHTYHLDI